MTVSAAKHGKAGRTRTHTQTDRHQILNYKGPGPGLGVLFFSQSRHKAKECCTFMSEGRNDFQPCLRRKNDPQKKPANKNTEN